MKSFTLKNSRTGLLMWALCASLAVLPARAPAEDIDLFKTDNSTSSTFDNANVLIILDNTSSWSRNDQQWPGGVKQGEAELSAIKTVIGQLDQSINVGLMMFTDSGSGRQGGYIRFPVLQMTDANKLTFQTLVQNIYDNFQSPSEKAAANALYSPVLFDAFKYFGGYTSPANVASGLAGTPTGPTGFGPRIFNELTAASAAAVPGALDADTSIPLGKGGYTDGARPSTAPTTYRPPISDDNKCAKNYIIFIGNGFPNDDMATMGPYLSGIGGNTTQLAVPGFTTTNVTTTSDIGYTSACYASGACQTTDFAAQCGTGKTYETCSCSGTLKTTLDACTSGQSRYQVLGNTTSSSSATTTTTTTNTGATAACYASAPSDTGLTGSQFGMSCPSTSVGQLGNVTTTTNYACSYAIGAATATSCASVSAVTTPGAATPTTAASTACYAANSSGDSAAAAAIAPTPTTGTDHGGLTCSATVGPTIVENTTTTISYACTWADSGRTSSGAACANTSPTGPTAGTAVVTTAYSTSCYNNNGAANSGIAGGDHGGLTCPATTTSAPSATGVVTTTTYSCAYARDTGSGATQQGSCATGLDQYRVSQTATPSVSTAQTNTRHTVTKTETPSTLVVTTASGGNHFAVTQTVVATATAVTTGGSSTELGNTFACYAAQPTGTPTDFNCSAYSSCTFGGEASTNACPSGTARYLVQGTKTTSTVVSNNIYAVPPTNQQRMADEWTRYMYQTDANSAAGQQNISTYTIDVFNAKQDADQTALLMSMARVGGGKYFAAKDENAIVTALKQIMSEIQAVNSVFASASLPVNATNRAQNENQVFIGMFRPDKKPRWYGNIKRYILANFSGVVDLADVGGKPAVNLQTGFISECATSWWTTDSGNYWENVPNNPPPTGKCTTSLFNQWSDSPDGPLVEKGAAAEVIRKGNIPGTTYTTPWPVDRRVKTLDSSNVLVDFTASVSGLSASLADFVLGKDVNDENGNGHTTLETRSSLHGDVVHSRPLPVNYATKDLPSEGVTVYYGANDGTLRAVDASNGKERWAFIAPEFFSTTSARDKFQRMSGLLPEIKYPSSAASSTERKDYFWDGSIGIYQNAANTDVKIFPTMRRGGRMIYAFSVTDKASLPASLPTYLWKLGCPNLDNDTGCKAPLDADDAKVTGIGQTWSMPSVAFIKGYPNVDPPAPEPVIVVGGGYDKCEDDDSTTPAGCAKGAAVYVIRVSTGEVIKKFDTLRSVPSDVAMVDVNNDGYVDYAYVTDTGGNLYRFDFVDATSSYAALAPADWTAYRVAYTNGAGRKFFYPPALLSVKNGYVYTALGSGDREHPLAGDYPFSNVTNRFYSYLDKLSFRPTTTGDADEAKNSVNLDDPAKLNDMTLTDPTDCDADPVLTTSSKKGWFMNLNQYGAGEQTVTSALILGGLVTFSTNRPIPAAAGSCSTTLGEARGYWVNLLNGSGGIGVGTANTCGGDRSAIFVGGGLPPSPVTGTVPVDGVSRTVIIGAVQRDGSASAPIGGQKVVPAIKAVRKRVYWFKNVD